MAPGFSDPKIAQRGNIIPHICIFSYEVLSKNTFTVGWARNNVMLKILRKHCAITLLPGASPSRGNLQKRPLMFLRCWEFPSTSLSSDYGNGHVVLKDRP